MSRARTFAEFLQSFKSGWGAASAALTVGPLALWGVGLTPPWPTEDGAAAGAIGFVAGLTGLILAYQRQQKQWRGPSRAAVVASLVMVLGFASVWSLTVVPIEQRIDGKTVERRFVTGFYATPRAAGLTQEQAIKRYGLASSYTPTSLLLGRLALLGTWSLMILFVTYGFGLQQMSEPPDGGGDPTTP